MPKIPIAEIKVGNRNRFDIGNIQELAEDIQRYGLLHPPVVTAEKELVAGYRRLKAVELLGWTEASVTMVEPQQSLVQFDMQLAENIQRKDLNPLEISEAILERKHRFEQVYGEIKQGGDHIREIEEKSKVRT
ncbi:MAG: ParB N-terminal domain-containing protein [bacterium]|nr:ParB N-terminal domain-containing protein [bacterium]